MAQAAGAVSASRLTCTASRLAAAQTYGTWSYFEAETELLPYVKRWTHPPGFGYSQIHIDENSEDSEYTYTYETIDDDEF